MLHDSCGRELRLKVFVMFASVYRQQECHDSQSLLNVDIAAKSLSKKGVDVSVLQANLISY